MGQHSGVGDTPSRGFFLHTQKIRRLFKTPTASSPGQGNSGDAEGEETTPRTLLLSFPWGQSCRAGGGGGRGGRARRPPEALLAKSLQLGGGSGGEPGSWEGAVPHPGVLGHRGQGRGDQEGHSPATQARGRVEDGGFTGTAGAVTDAINSSMTSRRRKSAWKRYNGAFPVSSLSSTGVENSSK